VGAARLNAIESGRSALVELWFVNTILSLRLLPVKVFDTVADLFGINNSMDDFHGRKGDRV